MAWTLNGNDLQKVQSEQSRKSSGIFKMPIPTTDSASAIGIDLFGAERVITVKGRMTGNSVGDLADKAAILDGFVTGEQTPVNYISEVVGKLNSTAFTTKVLVLDVDYTFVAGTVQFIDYTIQLLEVAP